ncbi:hypothetical protein ABER59_17005 [Bacillus velezensis]|uniref:hypothetical protein n=1 Tax=Bacillus velezensis TaxID=492670 RepID=UPI000F599727|nr:hypothetical protein [Bacillus velezensis]AZJ44176.1 hypothetical protein EG882_13180 [Bacillus velezensis]
MEDSKMRKEAEKITRTSLRKWIEKLEEEKIIHEKKMSNLLKDFKAQEIHKVDKLANEINKIDYTINHLYRIIGSDLLGS